MPSRSLPRHRAERAAAIGQDATRAAATARPRARTPRATPSRTRTAVSTTEAGTLGDGTDAAASWATNVTRAALVKEYFESRAIETTIGVAALPVGIALALAGRKHHQKLTLALVAGFGVWLGLMAIDLLRDLVPNVLGDSVDDSGQRLRQLRQRRRRGVDFGARGGERLQVVRRRRRLDVRRSVSLRSRTTSLTTCPSRRRS